MKMNVKKKVELLVPAGGKRQFIAAVENGADAVYLGGRAFNARINAGNFDDEMMQMAVDYAHKRGVKVFVTMNTLLRVDELDEALAYAGFLYETGVDALIIQDLGFGELVRKRYPDFERHLSTQASSYDVNAVKAAHELGYKRVVPARELTLEEIKAVCEVDLCDIEIFVHGALCICYSGQCQLSRYYGGRSGNRGMCAQACRLPYNCDGVKSYHLSPRDNCLIDCMGELIDAGVYSFKIEGRMKSPEYVAVVTRIYRKYIDEYLEKGAYEVSDEDRLALLQIFNRGDFTKGYLYGESGQELMSDFIPKNKGVKVGEVIKVKKGSTLVDVSLDSHDIDLSMGDGVETHRPGSVEIPSSTVISYIKPVGDNQYRIGDLKADVKVGDLLYRTSSKNQLDEVRRSFERFSLEDNPDERKPIRKLPIRMELLCYGGTITLTAEAVVKGTARKDKAEMVSAVVVEGPFDYGENPTPEDRYESALHKTGNTPFEIASIHLEGDFDISIKMSELNSIRRACLEELERKLAFRRNAEDIDVEKYEAKELPAQSELFFYNIKSYRRFRERNELANSVKCLLPLAEMIEEDFEVEPCVIPYISNITKGRESEILNSHLDDVQRLCGESGVYVGNLGWLIKLREMGIKVYGDFGLNAYNDECRAVIEKLGAEYATFSLESAEEDALYYPLMVSEHEFSGVSYVGINGKQKLSTVERDYSSQSLLVPKIDKNYARGRIEEVNDEANGYTRVYVFK